MDDATYKQFEAAVSEGKVWRQGGYIWQPEDYTNPSKLQDLCLEWRAKFTQGVWPRENKKWTWFNLDHVIWGAMRLMEGVDIPRQPTMDEILDQPKLICQTLDEVIRWCHGNSPPEASDSAQADVQPNPSDRPKADPDEVKEQIEQMVERGDPYPGSYAKLADKLKCSTGLLSRIFNAEGNLQLKDWTRNKSVSSRTYENTDADITDDDILPDDELDEVLMSIEKQLPTEDERKEFRQKIEPMSQDERRKLCLVYQDKFDED